MANKQLQQFEKHTFTNKFMFAKVMENKDLCKKVVECLLGRPIGNLRDVISEHQMCQTEDGKAIRMDIYTEDDKEIFDVEMQNLNKKPRESLELPKRSRFYQSEIDVDFLNRGSSYKSLPENNVIFICTFDPFGRGKAVYQFENRSDETPPEPLGDGTRKYFFNCTYEGSNIPKELIHFYEFVRTGKAEDSLTEDLKNAVEEKNMAYIYQSDYLRLREMKDDAREEGREEERRNTELERQRADAEQARADVEKMRADAAEARAKAAEEELERLRKQLEYGGDAGDDVSKIDIYNTDTISCMKIYQQLNQFFAIDSKSVDYDSVVQDFIDGKIVFTVATTDILRRIEEAKAKGECEFDFGVADMPGLTEDFKTRTMSVTECIVVNGYSEHPYEANAFAKYLCKDNSGDIYKMSGKLAAHYNVNYGDSNLDTFVDVYADSVPMPKTIETSNLWMELEIAFTEIWNGADCNSTLKQVSESIMKQVTGKEYTEDTIPDPNDDVITAGLKEEAD